MFYVPMWFMILIVNISYPTSITKSTSALIFVLINNKSYGTNSNTQS
jgi:hypothetical protein